MATIFLNLNGVWLREINDWRHPVGDGLGELSADQLGAVRPHRGKVNRVRVQILGSLSGDRSRGLRSGLRRRRGSCVRRGGGRGPPIPWSDRRCRRCSLRAWADSPFDLVKGDHGGGFAVGLRCDADFDAFDAARLKAQGGAFGLFLAGTIVNS